MRRWAHNSQEEVQLVPVFFPPPSKPSDSSLSDLFDRNNGHPAEQHDLQGFDFVCDQSKDAQWQVRTSQTLRFRVDAAERDMLVGDLTIRQEPALTGTEMK